jgi:hypothetical protein
MITRSYLRQIALKTETLFPESDDLGLILANLVWGLWFVWLSLTTIITCFSHDTMMTDLAFAQGVGIASAIAILFTLRPSIKSQRVHVTLLIFSCFLYFGMQRPASHTPHGVFLSAFKNVQKGMTASQVRTIMFCYEGMSQPNLIMEHGIAPAWWQSSHYSGKVCFNHKDSDYVAGYYHVTFVDGQVTEILLYDD